jgi:hypothetical protein
VSVISGRFQRVGDRVEQVTSLSDRHDFRNKPSKLEPLSFALDHFQISQVLEHHQEHCIRTFVLVW